MRLAASPVPVSSNSDSLTTPPSVGSLPVITTRASGHDVGLAARTRPVVPPWRTPLGDAIGRPADARARAGQDPGGPWVRPAVSSRSRCGTTVYRGSLVDSTPAWNTPNRWNALPV